MQDSKDYISPVEESDIGLKTNFEVYGWCLIHAVQEFFFFLHWRHIGLLILDSREIISDVIFEQSR